MVSEARTLPFWVGLAGANIEINFITRLILLTSLLFGLFVALWSEIESQLTQVVIQGEFHAERQFLVHLDANLFGDPSSLCKVVHELETHHERGRILDRDFNILRRKGVR